MGYIEKNILRNKMECSEFEIVLFDLDGTLTDPGLGITNSIIYALKKMGEDTPSREELYKFIGPPLIDSFMEYYHYSEKQARIAANYYHEYFAEKGMFENRPYDGITDLLSDLKKENKCLIVASAKPEIFVKKILHHFNLYDFFDFVAGSELNGVRTRKHEVIHYVLSQYILNQFPTKFLTKSKSQILMVGDRQDDIQGAQKNGLPSLGVLYGFGSREELTKAGADWLAESVADLHHQLVKS